MGRGNPEANAPVNNASVNSVCDNESEAMKMLVTPPPTRSFRHVAAAATIAVTLVVVACPAAERLRMAQDNATEIEARDCLKAAAQAASDENLEGFIGCFAKKQRPRIRRKVAILFVRHSIDLELLDSHLVSEEGERAELAVKYRATLSDDSCDVVSLVGLTREAEGWRIAREKVESNSAVAQRTSASQSGGQVFRFGGGGDVVLGPQDDDGLPADIGRRPGGGCANGRCGLPR